MLNEVKHLVGTNMGLVFWTTRFFASTQNGGGQSRIALSPSTCWSEWSIQSERIWALSSGRPDSSHRLRMTVAVAGLLTA